LTGCLPESLDVPELPELLDAVVQNENQFRASADDPLLDVAPGTAVDPADQSLIGCWGKILDDGGQAPLTISNAMRFAADGTYESWWLSYGDGFVGLFTVLYGEAGTYEIVDTGRLLISVQRDWTWDPLTGGEIEEEDVERVRTSLVTLSADSMMFVSCCDDPNSVAPEDREGYLYARFECP
jgi:hypothetical protein